MALVAMTNADVVKYVSRQDPCKKLKKIMVPQDPENPDAGLMEVKRKPEDPIEYDIAEGATTFSLRALDVYLTAAIYDGAQVIGRGSDEEVRIHTNVNKTNVEAVRYGLTGIENFSDANGRPIAFKTSKAMLQGRQYDVVDDSVMNVLGIQLIQELGAEIKALSEVRPALQKN